MSSTGSSDSGSNPSMLHGHAAYVAAAAKVCMFTTVTVTALNVLHERAFGESFPAVRSHHDITS